jgi:AcrR family transcriptional regulator
VPEQLETGRINQRHRSRKDLLSAAARLLKAGRTPDMDEVAKEAMVSRATAYRYFPSVEALLVEAPLDGAMPTPHDLFAGNASTDPAERVDRAEAALHAAAYRNEAALRVMLAASLQRKGGVDAGNCTPGNGVPVRQNRRTPLIEAALAPARDRITDEAYGKLCAALALVFGTESMIVFRDVLGVDENTARDVKSWAARALVRAALADSEGGEPGPGANA